MIKSEMPQLLATIESTHLAAMIESPMFPLDANGDLLKNISFELLHEAGVEGVDNQEDLKLFSDVVHYLYELDQYQFIIKEFQVPVSYLKFIKQFMDFTK
ncbi:TPA: hypothetical protein ACGIK9_003395 [Acinetobacter baumannii]|uniref:hypothetical protein n=1 Tax=Acinetobacter baumannii TaxID=470 RepID=UPI00338EB368